MPGFIVFITVFALLVSILSWGCRNTISWFFKRKYNIILKIGGIKLWYLQLYDIQISKNGFNIQIDNISIKSSLLNSELTKLVTLIVKDVRINKDIGLRSDFLEVPENNRSKSADSRETNVPHFINTIAQFMAVHVHNISAMLLRAETPCLIHATAHEVKLDGNILKNASFLLVTLNVFDGSAKVLRHAENQSKESCLAEFSFAISTEIVFLLQGPLSIDKLDVKMSHTSALINDSLYKISSRTNSVQDNDAKRDGEDLHKLVSLIPKNCSIQIDDTSLKGVRENGQLEYSSSLKKISLNYRTVPSEQTKNQSPHGFFNLFLCDLQLQNRFEKLLHLKTFVIDAKLKDYIIDLYLQLQNLSVTYNHDVIHQWLYSNFLKNRTKNTSKTKESPNDSWKWDEFDSYVKKFMLNICAEFAHISATVKLSDRNASIGFNHVKFMLEQAHEYRGRPYRSQFLKLLLHDRHWQTEFLIESFWWSFKEWNQDSNVTTKKMHVWGTPLYFVKVLVKIWTQEQSEMKVVSLLDTVQLEWSLELVDYVLLAIKCFKQYPVEMTTNNAISKTEEAYCRLSITVVINHVNFLCQSQNNEYFVLQTNSIELSQDAEIVNVEFEELKIFTISDTGAYYSCMRSEDMANYKVYIKKAHVEYVQKLKQFTLNLLDEIKINWAPNLHLKAAILVKDISEFMVELHEELNSKHGTKEQSTGLDWVWQFHILGNFGFLVEISKQNSMEITFDALSLSKTQKSFTLQNAWSEIAINSSDIFTVKGFHFYPIKDHELVRAERLDTDNLQLAWNKTWGVSIDLFKVVFPFEHNFADAILNEFVLIVKWLKIVHNLKKAPFSEDSPLPSDLVVNIKEFLFEMSDDPFEVKLRDNFELLEDEYNESLKRQKMLKERVAELCKTHLHLPAAKVEELYNNLKKKNAEIYIQRSKQMLKASPPRTRLFALNMTCVELMILADPSIHGTDNVVKIMKEIDSDSPWPEENMDFSTLWCRVVSFRCKEWKIQLRDFPQPLLDIKQCYICGQLVGAEQVAPRRAVRSVAVHLGEPFEPFIVERGMQPLKFYHDFNCEVEFFSYAFGPCWEPVMAQCNLSFEKISAPSRDPSPPMSFWDKVRLLLHGRLTMVVKQLTVLLHASLDPYNTTEEMELTWNQVVMDWTNAKYVFKGDLDIFVRTASKYDDCKMLHLPNLKLILGIHWVCLGDPNDHHSVIYCAPDKVPEYSSNQMHDSFRAFRSQNVNLNVTLETRPAHQQANNNGQSPMSANLDCPTLLLYGSTLRWIENLKLILSGVTRPTKRGHIFQNVRPKKVQLSRHYKKVHVLMGLHKFQVCYWMSYAMQRGCELIGGRLSSSSEHMLNLNLLDDGLIHRPKAEWSIVYMNSDLNDSEIWLKSALQEDSEIEAMSLRQPVEKCYCLSVAKVSYGRETVVPNRDHNNGCERNKDTPTHRLVVYDLRGAWTKSNRNVAFALFDTFMKNKQMKKNLSTEGLKGFRKDSSATPLKRRNTTAAAAANSNDTPGTPPNATSIQQTLQLNAAQDVPSPISRLQSGHAANMLQQLIAEADNKSVVYSDDLSTVTRQQHLQGLQACQEDDVQHRNWQIALVNGQVLLKGSETQGYVILSAAKAEIIQRIHSPVWKDRTLVSKTTWTGLLECMQYYATVNAGENDDSAANENIMWLTVDNIQEKESTEISEPSEVPNMVGSGVSVGAVVSDTVGPSSSRQLQRIVSRCKCEFFYAGYGDISVDPGAVAELPPPPQDETTSPWDRRQNAAVDAFTLMHHDLDVCTNSLQYAMLLDIVNNLLLFVEPHRKEALEKLARMRFQLQLHSVDDQRRPIQNQQTLVRTTVSKLRRLEKETYLVSKVLAENPDNEELVKEMARLEKAVYDCKNQLNAQSEELDMMLSCYKETQLLTNSRLATTRSDKPLTVVRANEICFKRAQWRLTEADGQIGIADLGLSNFLYTKNSKSDDSVEHLLELGYMRMTNLLPNEIYKEVLCPSEIQHGMPIEYKRVLRIFCREKPPVGGISVKEHFEINLVPLTIGMTKKFYSIMMKFCFPERENESNDFSDRTSEDGVELSEPKVRKSSKAMKRNNRDSNFYVPFDDVEKMKERAEKNKLFVYIKIPEVPVKVSYKGNKEKNLEDLRDVSLVIPTLEYHNMTWTWLDLLMAIRNDSKRVILSQAIKQKLQIKRNTGSLDESSSPQEEDKARMLFGARHAPENKSIRKGVGGVFKFGK